MTAEISEKPAVSPVKDNNQGASNEAWNLMAAKENSRPNLPSTAQTQPLELTDSQQKVPQLNKNGQVQFENSKGAVSCPVPQSESYGQFLFFRFSSHETGKPDQIAGVCKDAIGQFQKLESADQAFDLAAKIPDQNLRKAVELSIYENELKRANLKMMDVAFEEVELLDTRSSAKLSPAERKARIEKEKERIADLIHKPDEPTVSQPISESEAITNQRRLTQYLKEVGVSEADVKYNLEHRVPLGWDVRQMRQSKQVPSNSPPAEIPKQSSSKTPLSSVPEGQVFVRTDINVNQQQVLTEFTAPTSQSSSKASVGLSLFGQPVIAIGGGEWHRGAEPPPEVEQAIAHSLHNQMDAEVWERGKGTKHQAGIENAIMKERGQELPHPYPR